MSNLNNVHIVELSRYEMPSVIETNNSEFVSYGDDNNHFNYLIDRFTKSTTNNAIIKGVVNMIFGKGIDATDSNRKPNQYAEMRALLKDNDLYRIVFDRKLLGMAAMQVTYDKNKVKKITHFPMETLRASKYDSNGDIAEWYYHPNWLEYKKGDTLKSIKSFGFGNKKGNEIYILKPYVSGYYYYTPVDYVGAIPYALLEEEIANYLINDTQNGFSGSKVVNFNNGIPDDEEKQRQIKDQVVRKLTGTRGEKVIVAFNDNKESATTVENLPLDNAPEHYQYLSDECRNKLIMGHNVTSPLLVGVREAGGGLGSNADEIKNSSIFFDNIVIKPYQNEIIDALNEIFAVNDIKLNLYFKTIQPLEFIDVNGLDAERKEEETGVKMSVQCSAQSHKYDNEIANALIEVGEDENDDEWILIDERDVDYDLEEELDEQINRLNESYKDKNLLSKIWKFVSTGTARPNSKSEQDKTIDGVKYKVRYQYSPQSVSSNSREFCKKMVSANKLYRKEDIIAMENKVVNAGWGANGADTYSIWLYKGGGSCHHKWLRKTYKSAKGSDVDVKSPKANTISTNKAEKEGYRVRNPKEVAMKPKDMKNEGFLKPRK